MSHNEKVFVLGAPRSGTTFLSGLLSETRFGAPFETHFITKYHHKLSEYGDLSEVGNFSRLLNDILSERPVMQWQLEIDIESFYHSLEGNFSYSNIVDQLCRYKNIRQGTGAWGDKTPNYIGEFDLIYSLFPDAKFLHIVRDGRDVALSLLERSWGPNNLFSAAEYWRDLNRKNPLLEKLTEEGKVYQVRYEDLLDDTETHVRSIYEFLGEELSEQTLRSLCSTVRKGNYFKWKKRLSKRQISLFDKLAANTLSRMNYETFEPEAELSAPLRFIYKLHNKLIWLKFMFVINVVDGIKIKFFGKQPFAE